ncbi:Asp23/Gls24 family envelope stress response protein [Varibaculum cambriense]|uniref:Asp23/Gls24 family envelope stress response protein n=1 Tax=Varibaculum cambriense TaxID=184870 RepID=UPI0028FFE91B|nr:Asp23/Gls24 family envelope stress response protein [Varibaculum cambriense]MDU1684555.1 Asp23/Gls24 family envelope stress response protein [Varibaculum cambriense]
MANSKQDKKTPTVVPTAEEAKELIPANNVAEDQGQGLTTVADQVVAKVAGLAIKEIPGVYDLGNSAARALGALRSKVGASESITQGISVEIGQTQTALDVVLIVEYPYPAHEVADKVREAIFSAIEGLVGLEVTEVNIKVTDVHVPDDDDNEEDEDQKDKKDLK